MLLGERSIDRDLIATWNRLMAVREQVLAEIEPLRKDKQIGSSLQAKVILSAAKADDLALLDVNGPRHRLYLRDDTWDYIRD